ncbi:MAG TPA: hypothetical protein VKJ01_02950 [Candidatus Solibacter sp.]|nr:hypothetical protein [Candidatus Solibacter sp.]
MAQIEVPLVMSTHENPQAAIRGETCERDEMYPAFIAAPTHSAICPLCPAPNGQG